MNNSIIYLDHAAATPVDPLVFEAMRPYFSENFFNPSSPYAPAVHVKRAYQEAKSCIARQLGARADEIIMTAGATESINLAFAAVSGQCLVAATEHAAVLAAANRQQSAIVVPPTKKGVITAEAVQAALTPEVELVSIALANHELGTIQPIHDIAQVIGTERRRRQQNGDTRQLLFHTDASQAGTLLDIKPSRLGVDLLTLSASKMYGPKQVAILWAKPQVELRPLLVGGGQERGLRSGTENVAGAVAMATAMELAASRRPSEVKRLKILRDQMSHELHAAFPEMIVSSDDRKSLANYLTISFAGLDAERLVFVLETERVLVATGSACSANSHTRSSVLGAIGLSDQQIDGSLRLTLGRLSTEDNCRTATEKIIQTVKKEQARLGL